MLELTKANAQALKELSKYDLKKIGNSAGDGSFEDCGLLPRFLGLDCFLGGDVDTGCLDSTQRNLSVEPRTS